MAATIMQDRGLSDHRPPRRSPHVARCRHMALDRGPRTQLTHPLHLFAALVFVLAASLSLPGCTTQLAPDYDKTIVDGLTTANEQTLTLFASITSGVSRASFSAREPNYDLIIGKFDALRVQAMARPTPQPWLLKAFGSSRRRNPVLRTTSRLRRRTLDAHHNQASNSHAGSGPSGNPDSRRRCSIQEQL